MRFYRLILFLIFSIGVLSVQAQDYAEESDYKSEFYGGLNMNTNGGVLSGLTLKASWRYKPRKYHAIYLEIVNVKNPKEVRVVANANNNTYIYKKTNYLFPVRLLYGREFVLFKKSKDEGIHLNGNVALGPSFGIVKPYLLLYGPSSEKAKPTQYYDKMNLDSIYGGAGILSGFDQAKLVMGLTGRVSAILEFGSSRNITGLELGFLVEAYTQKIELTPETEARSKSVFTSAFAVIYFGRRN